MDQQHASPTLHTTLWHIIPKRAHQNSGLSSSLLPLGDQSIGARRVGLTCTPGMPAPPPPCANRSNKSLTFVNPLGKFLSSVHDKSHQEKPGRILQEGLPLTTPSAVSSAVMPHESHTEHDCFSSLGNLNAYRAQISPLPKYEATEKGGARSQLRRGSDSTRINFLSFHVTDGMPCTSLRSQGRL